MDTRRAAQQWAEEELLARQSAPQQEAGDVLAGLDLATLVADIGPLQVAGSLVSGLMCWRELDVMLLVGDNFSPQDVLRLLARIVEQTGATALDYHDERGLRCVTGQVRDERYHVPFTVDWAGHCWRIDRSEPVQRHRYRGVMAHITGHIRIASPVERVFDTVADSRNEPSFNPAMTGVELLTPPPVGLGTRFRARMGKAGMEMLVELTEFDRPRRLGSRTASSMMETSGTLAFAADGQGTVMSWDWQVRPRGWLRMLGPLAGPLGGRMERRIWTGLKRQLEDDASAHPA